MSTNTPIILNMDFDTIKNKVLTNLVKMIGYRQWIKKTNIDKIIGEVTSIDNDNMLYSIELDVDLKNFEVYDFTDDLEDIDDELIDVLKDVGLPEDKKKIAILADSKKKEKYYKNNPDGTEEDRTSKEEKNKTKKIIEDKKFIGNKIYVKLFPQQKISSVEKTPALNEFIKKYDKYHRIIVVESMTDKPMTKLQEYPNIEVFNESFLMINLTDFVLSPEYNVLTGKIAEQFKKDYKILNLHYLPIMYDTDPAAKYLYVKKGQIIRIIRRTKNTETSIGYRVIAKKGVAKI